MIDTNTYPKISIITPSYNQGEFIERTIVSILSQKYSNIEYIIIDGGSTDNTVEIIKKYEDRITYWVSEKDTGTYDANNKGLAKITGDYWCVVNSDDVLLPGAIEAIVKTIQDNPDEKWIVGGVNFIDEKDVVFSSKLPVKPSLIAGYSFLQSCWILHPGVFIHKHVIDTVGVFEKYHSMDLNYWLRMEKHGYSPFVLNTFVACLRMHSACKSNDFIKANEEVLKVYTDFVASNNLDKNKDIRYKLKEDTLNYLKMMLYNNLVRNRKLHAFKDLIKIGLFSPSVILKEWYLGAFKRFVFGIKATDPLINMYSFEEEKANWNNA